jgi:4-amino-4-deoxy-L-arabinose transferase-like glycosyltransferase
MRIGIKRTHPVSRLPTALADVVASAWASPAAELIAVAALLTLAVLVATWFSLPALRISAADPAASRYLSGFWDVEHTDTASFRWSRAEAAIRLFGLEQRAPVLFQARLSASRQPGQPLAQLTIGEGATATRFPIRREWRRYMALLPAPPRDAEGRAIALHTLANPPYEDSRDLGLALDWFAAAPQPRTTLDHLPDAGRLTFLVTLGLLGYAALRRIGMQLATALLLALVAATALGSGIIGSPAALAYWLPNLWLLVLAGWLALLLPKILPWLRQRQSRYTPVAALIAVGAAMALLPLQQSWSSAAGWALLLGGAIMLAAVLPALPSADPNPLSRRTIALSLTAITLVALALRLVGLDGLPLGMWRDEARHGLLALRILNDPSYRPVYVPNIADIPALLFYLDAVPISLFGAHPWSVRLVPALAGALTPLALYFAARPLFGARTALLAAALLAISAWSLSLSRLAFAATLGPPLTLLAIGLVWRAFATTDDRRPTTDDRRWTMDDERSRMEQSSIVYRLSSDIEIPLFSWRGLEAALAGVATGLAIYTYHPSRLTPLVVAIAIALRLGWDRRAWRMAVPRLALLGIAAALVAWPLISYGMSHRASFSQRIGQTSIFNSDSLAGRAPLARIEENVRLNLGLWNERGDRIGRHNLPDAPMLDPLTGAAFAIGAGLILTRLSDRRALLLALWMGVALAPGIFSIEAPHAVRTVETITPAILLAAVGCFTLATRTKDEGRRTKDEGRKPHLPSSLVVRRWSGGILTAGLLIAVFALNGARYFVAWPQSPKAYEEFFVAETHAGELIQRLAAQPEIRAGSYQIYVPASALQNDVVRYLTSGIPLETFAHNRLATPAGDHALLIDIGEQASDPQALRQALGDGAVLLGSGPISPLSGGPEWTIYGRGPAAAQAVAQALASL